MEKKKGFNKENKQNEKQEIKDLMSKCNIAKAKEVIIQNKKQTISILSAIIVIIAIALTAIIQTSRKGQSVIDPELAKAMTYAEVQEGEEAVEGTDNVKFDAFFLRDINNDGYAESIRGTSKQIGKEDTLYMELNILTEGYLKDAKITIDGKNFYFQTSLPKDQQLKENYIGNNIKKLEFNDMSNGTQKMITGMVRSGDYSYDTTKAQAIGNNINNYSKVNSVTLTGTYVGADGNEVEINKTVEFNIDWYGTVKAEIASGVQRQYVEDAVNEEEGTINLNIAINAKETANELILSKNYVEATIPELNGYAPSDVIHTGSNAVFNYDAQTRKVTFERTAVVDSDGKVTSGIPRDNRYAIKVVYPLEAYQTIGTETVQILVPAMTYYEGYNNQSEEFTNPYKSNTARTTLVFSYDKKPAPTQGAGWKTDLEIKVGKSATNPTNRYIISKDKPLRIYNGKSESEKDDTYVVMWKATVGTDAKLESIVMKETKEGQEQVSDQFIKTNSEEISAGDVTTNVGIYFVEADTALGEDGWIKVYDEGTGNLLETFTKDNWNKYKTGNPYKYATPVKHIRVETSNAIKSEVNFYAYNIKEIEDEKITEKYTKEQFDELQYIKSTLVGYLAGEEIATRTHQANYEAPMSIATIKISKETISTQETVKNEQISITTRSSEINNQTKWKNGTFLIKLPKEIIDIEIDSVRISNDLVRLENYEIIEQDNSKFIKIITQNDTPAGYTINLDVAISPDPRIATTTSQIELYATNENNGEYYYYSEDKYDINNNLNVMELVNYATVDISMTAPNSLLTNQMASNYDEKGSTIISPQIAEIKPIYAVVDQESKEQTAKIGVQIRNNYANTISEVKILGKIPFEGNTYVISEGEIGSTFTTKMTSDGVKIPEELQGVVTVYYSENENPSKDIEDYANGWKIADSIENWDNVKTYLIDLEDYVIPTGKEYTFYYDVEIPQGVEFNKVAFSHHGVYFSLDTEQGKYRTQTEPNKLGFRMVEKYDLELQKYQKGKDKVIPEAIYSVKEIKEDKDLTETEGEAKTYTTNSEGKLKVANLYAEKIYEIKEIRAPYQYELNESVIRIIGHVDNQGVLTIEKLQGDTREDIEVVKKNEENYKAIVKVEDKVRANINITKKEKGTDIRIPNVKYKITGYNFPENGTIIATNNQGEISIKGISINKEYTLQEVKAEGYYLADPIKFKITENEEKYEVEIIDGTMAEYTIEDIDSIPTLNITLEDNKIPRYNLQITKIKRKINAEASKNELPAGENEEEVREETIYLPGVKFKLYKNGVEIGEYITDSEGKILINDLYQFDEEEGIEQTYTLKEVMAPVGYSKINDIMFEVRKIDGILKLDILEGTQAKYETNNETIELTIEDSPSFRLIKRDADTKEPIKNVKFAIFDADTNEPAKNSNGEILGVKENINGIEYYVISTDNEGEITENLTEGTYKAIEVQATEEYVVNDKAYYFSIGASKESKQTIQAEWAKDVAPGYIYSVCETRDEGYIVGGKFSEGKYDLGNGVVIENTDKTPMFIDNGMVVKYNEKGEAEWAKTIKENYESSINAVVETNDGGYIVGGYFSSKNIELENGIILNNNSDRISGYPQWECEQDGMIIKYGVTGEIEWAKAIGGKKHDTINSIVATSDGGCLVGGYSGSDNVELEGSITLTKKGGMLIKYSSEGRVEWAKEIGSSITSISETSDKGYIVGGRFEESNAELENGVMLTNKGKGDGIVVKYDSKGKIEWKKEIGGNEYDYITSVLETKEGGYIIGGYFYSDSIELENGISLTARKQKRQTGMIIKCDGSGNTKWAESPESPYEVSSIVETNEGKYVVGGADQSTYKITILQYDETGKIEWKETLKGRIEILSNSTNDVDTMVTTKDGGFIIGGNDARS